jgi:hypothetical protein
MRNTGVAQDRRKRYRARGGNSLVRMPKTMMSMSVQEMGETTWKRGRGRKKVGFAAVSGRAAVTLFCLSKLSSTQQNSKTHQRL